MKPFESVGKIKKTKSFREKILAFFAELGESLKNNEFDALVDGATLNTRSGINQITGDGENEF